MNPIVSNTLPQSSPLFPFPLQHGIHTFLPQSPTTLVTLLLSCPLYAHLPFQSLIFTFPSPFFTIDPFHPYPPLWLSFYSFPTLTSFLICHPFVSFSPINDSTHLPNNLYPLCQRPTSLFHFSPHSTQPDENSSVHSLHSSTCTFIFVWRHAQPSGEF